ncbi:hypothetical protein PKB_4467 [Pseudomonas knackmussii B13]|uniref:Uncharacterized protein n=1 Tax=Pseudomonas knackmussii (strain DSM 6978 / CCUG 54928 / LMG 23759 / B13) TaxID=1301098 RepID=A0A024HLP4_PSEKB|nr:hypothetical protein PKB_4467 [Pseudomonas knackmussii B13]
MNTQWLKRSTLFDDNTWLFYVLAVAWLLCSGI